MFNKILIANRGEIACRVIKTAKRMGISCVAVYSEADANALHVRLADEAYLLGPAPSKSSYLRADKIIEIAKLSGAQAIHPGYGFLSENEAFAQSVEDHGLVFIGPKAASIRAMGDKIASKHLAKDAQVSTIPGYNEVIADANEALNIAKGIGFPVMIKASAGGGGKGLRVAYNDQQTIEGFQACQNEARASFGDDRIFIEKFIEQPRHIEIQILGDAHGHVIYLNERECSIQRRHQKVIEEAPSPFISSATRKAMGEQAVALAKAVHYQSAGTVEFVVDKDQNFYFLEMNTRLQVEHPVTECITGLDLVEWMIKVAAGEAITLKQEDVKINGWAMECRINAEDPLRQFLPSIGRLSRFTPPQTTLEASRVDAHHGVRVDTGVREGGEISMHYDSMIAKLIVHAPDRESAIQSMREALNAFVVRGVQSNIGFQLALLSHPKFASGEFNTGFIAEHFPNGFTKDHLAHPNPSLMMALAACVQAQLVQRNLPTDGHPNMESADASVRFEVVDMDHKLADGARASHQVEFLNWIGLGKVQRVSVGSQVFEIEIDLSLHEGLVKGVVNGVPFMAQFDRGDASNPMVNTLTQWGFTLHHMVLSNRHAELYRMMPVKEPPDLSKFLLSPMPGLLTQILVKEGQKVMPGERLAIIEAMKMENVLLSHSEVQIKSIAPAVGESLSVDQIIMEFE
jgi:propionyl-CoA carboxylase alpha chain